MLVQNLKLKDMGHNSARNMYSAKQEHEKDELLNMQSLYDANYVSDIDKEDKSPEICMDAASNKLKMIGEENEEKECKEKIVDEIVALSGTMAPLKIIKAYARMTSQNSNKQSLNEVL